MSQLGTGPLIPGLQHCNCSLALPFGVPRRSEKLPWNRQHLAAPGTHVLCIQMQQRSARKKLWSCCNWLRNKSKADFSATLKAFWTVACPFSMNSCCIFPRASRKKPIFSGFHAGSRTLTTPRSSISSVLSCKRRLVAAATTLKLWKQHLDRGSSMCALTHSQLFCILADESIWSRNILICRNIEVSHFLCHLKPSPIFARSINKEFNLPSNIPETTMSKDIIGVCSAADYGHHQTNLWLFRAAVCFEDRKTQRERERESVCVCVSVCEMCLVLD